MKIKVTFESHPKWKTIKHDFATIYYIGNEDFLTKSTKFILNKDFTSLRKAIASYPAHYSIIVEYSNIIFAVVDTIRSYPLFFISNDDLFIVSNSSKRIYDEYNEKEVDESCLLEFRHAGYVSGNNTIYKNIKQLQAGEYLLFNKVNHTLQMVTYYTYFPKESQESTSFYDYKLELGKVIDNIFQRMIDRAKGRPIWIPLSGGLDSRLIICKLHELGYNKLFAFSYGANNNGEAIRAQIISKKLNIPWLFVSPDRSKSIDFFNSEERKKYWQFASSYSSAPTMQDFEAIKFLKTKELLPDDAIIINGQSGDFITGGHLPKLVNNENPESFEIIDYIVEKHYSIWNDDFERRKDTALKALNLISEFEQEDLSKEIIAALYEQWEWRERQCKYVINGQRVYDYVNLNWLLPFWDLELMKFYEKVPLILRYDQKLYKEYLEDYNYKGLFKQNFLPTDSFPEIQFPFKKQFITILAKFFPSYLKKFTFYYGQYNPYYSYYSYDKYQSLLTDIKPLIPQARIALALTIKQWLTEKGL
jgi:asparagine synthase (glutamine-hydrolysing)